MTSDQLRKALNELSGERAATFALASSGEHFASFTVNNAMLVPAEPDGLIKVTDGESLYIIDAERVAWVRIGLARPLSKPS